MLDKARYTNHLNQSIEFGSDGIFLSGSEMRNYEWLYDNNYDEITNFRKGVVKKKFKIIIMSSEPRPGIEARNRIFEIFEQDVLMNQPGRLYIDGYYCTCYMVASKKMKWNISQRYLEIEATMATDSPDWVRESTFNYKKSEDGAQKSDSGIKIYSYVYNYRYSNYNATDRLINTAVIASVFILRIYGPVSNPLVMVGNNTYQVNVSIDDRERVEVSSKDKTIFLIRENGNKENVFWSASRQSYIFERIETGMSVISWNGSFDFDLVLVDKRSEPPWM